MDDLSMDEAKCSLVREMLSCQGHPHLRCPPAKRGSRTPIKELRDNRDDWAPPRRSVSVVDISIADAKRDLASSWNHTPAPILPLMSLLAYPAPSSSRLGMDVGQLTGRHLDACRQSRQDLAKRAPSPAEQECKKRAKTPSTEEEEEETDEMVRHSQEQRQERQWSQAHSKSRNRRRRRAKSQARAQAAESTDAKTSYIPAGYENTRQEELQCEARREREQSRKDKALERQQRGAEKAAELEEKLRDEVLYNQRAYVDRVTRRLKVMKLPAADPRVCCLWIFGGEASSHTAQILAIFDWASKYFKLGGEYPVPKLPGWLTTFINVTSISRFPEWTAAVAPKEDGHELPQSGYPCTRHLAVDGRPAPVLE